MNRSPIRALLALALLVGNMPVPALGQSTSSFPRKRESRNASSRWIPAFAGMT